jgi:glycosyltransferase involved in cell wall biosynthesis
MKVLFIAPNLVAGGAERQWSILLPGLRRRGMDARVILLDAGGMFVAPLQRAGVPVEVLWMRHQADLGRLLRSRLARHFDADAIVTQGVSGVYVGHLLSRLRGAPHLYNEHLQVGMSLLPRREKMIRLMVRWIDGVIAVSPGQADTWLARGYPRDRILVVPNGVEAMEVDEPRSEIRRELGIPDSAVVALLVAALRPEKRGEDFVHAVRRARAERPELIGVIAGDGVDRPAVEAAIHGDEAVRLLGERDDIPRLLAAADVFVLSSEFEALPMSILEAMAAGLPVLSTNVGNVPEIVLPGINGLLVPPLDPGALATGLVKLAASPELRASMGQAGADMHRGRWDAKTMIDRYEEILRGVGPVGRLRRTRG